MGLLCLALVAVVSARIDAATAYPDNIDPDAVKEEKIVLSTPTPHPIQDEWPDIDITLPQYAMVNSSRLLASSYVPDVALIDGTWNMMSEVMADSTKGNATLDDTCENVNVVNDLDIPILVMGAKDMIVAASSDGILIADKERSGYMKPYVEKISTDVRVAEKSWGTYTVINTEPEAMTVKIKLFAGNNMNYHSHNYRDEVWTVLSGEGRVVIDDKVIPVKQGDTVSAKAGVKHMIIADTDMSIIEVQMGKEISRKDKIIYESEYGKGKKK